VRVFTDKPIKGQGKQIKEVDQPGGSQ